MAVQDEASFKRYAANGVATVYAIPFLLLAAADLQVTLDGELVTSGFTVIGLGSNTGQIQFAAAPAGDLLLQRVVPFQRLTDYQDNGDLLSGTVNRDLDRLWLAVQELRRDDGRALVVSPLEPEGIPPLPVRALRQLRMLAFDLTGNPIPSNLTLEQLEQQPALAASAAEAAVEAAAESASSADAAELLRDQAQGYAEAAALETNASQAAALLAQRWANEDEDVPVVEGPSILYSAKHWALKAAAALSGLAGRLTTVESKVSTLESGIKQTPELLWSGNAGTAGNVLTLSRSLQAGDLVWLSHADGMTISTAPLVITADKLVPGTVLAWPFGQGGGSGCYFNGTNQLTIYYLTSGYPIGKIYASRAKN